MKDLQFYYQLSLGLSYQEAYYLAMATLPLLGCVLAMIVRFAVLGNTRSLNPIPMLGRGMRRTITAPVWSRSIKQVAVSATALAKRKKTPQPQSQPEVDSQQNADGSMAEEGRFTLIFVPDSVWAQYDSPTYLRTPGKGRKPWEA